MAKNKVHKSAQARAQERKLRERDRIIKMAAERASKQLEDRVASEAAIDNSRILYNILAHVLMKRFSLDAEEICEAYDESEAIAKAILDGTCSIEQIEKENAEKGLVIE